MPVDFHLAEMVYACHPDVSDLEWIENIGLTNVTVRGRILTPIHDPLPRLAVYRRFDGVLVGSSVLAIVPPRLEPDLIDLILFLKVNLRLPSWNGHLK